MGPNIRYSNISLHLLTFGKLDRFAVVLSNSRFDERKSISWETAATFEDEEHAVVVSVRLFAGSVAIREGSGCFGSVFAFDTIRPSGHSTGALLQGACGCSLLIPCGRIPIQHQSE